MNLELTNLHVLITGGSKGIGLACARGFIAEGARVTLVSRTLETLQCAQRELQSGTPSATVNIIAADLRDAAEAERMVDAVERDFGAVDVLVNSAGAAKRTPAAELTTDAWHDAMQAKFFTYIHVINPLIKKMGARGRGAVVNVIGAGGKVATVSADVSKPEDCDRVIAEALKALLLEPDDDPDDLEALDRAWAEEQVTFGPDQVGCPKAAAAVARMGETTQ